jgi:hypothetical protein
MMACNPPYKRGLTGQWDKCRFPGVLRQDCYDYINFGYNCKKLPECISVSGIDIAFHACHSCDSAEYDFYFGELGTDGKWDNNKQKYLGKINLNSNGSNYVTSIPDKYSCSNSKTTKEGVACCISNCSSKLSVQSLDIPSSVLGNIELSSTDEDCVEIFVKLNCALPGGVGCHSDVTKYIAYSKDECCLSTGTLNSASDVGYGLGVEKIKICCNSCSECSNHTFSNFDSLPGGVGSCLGSSIFYGEKTISIPSSISKPVEVTITGGVDDEFILNGEVIDAGLYPFAGSCNGAHEVDYSFTTSASSFTIACGDNHGAAATYNLNICFKKASGSSGGGGSSSSCNITAQLKTTGCCLELEESTGRMYAVGSGTVSSRIISGLNTKCCGDFSLKINGKGKSVSVQDGAYITVEANSKCKCTKKSPWRTPVGFKPSPCNKGPAPTPGPYRILKNIETGVYQIELNLNANSGQNDCGCG